MMLKVDKFDMIRMDYSRERVNINGIYPVQEDMSGSIFFDELYKQYTWYDSLFTPVVRDCSKEFFFDGLEYKLESVSTNMNILAQNETFFVTKVKINAKNDVYIRISQEAINVILDKVLGINNKRFDLTEVTELEARIITSFNDFLYEALAPNFTIEPNRRYTEILHLTYFVKSEVSGNAAKFIISVPKDILSPKEIDTTHQRYSDNDFASCPVEVDLLLGMTSFPLSEVKRLDVGDIVLFENSNSSEMTLICNDIIQKFKVKPNSNIIEPYEAYGGGDMNENNTNLWDSIQVDMSAEFDKVKVTLGELKSIEEGLVVDLCSVYDNKIHLKVGGKIVADGELVIINDRFGVRIGSVKDSEEAEVYQQQASAEESENAPAGVGENFDYSDFEVEDSAQ